MSEGWGHHYGGDGWEVFSAGSNPAGFVAEEAIEVMAEKGVDISSHHSKGIQELPYQSFDLVVLMGCGDNCPTLKAKKRLSWDIPDPIGQSLDIFRQVRDDLGVRIKELLTGKQSNS